MERGLQAVAVVVGTIGLAQTSGGIAMTARNGTSLGIVAAGLGTTLVVLAVVLVRISRRTGTTGNDVSPDAAHVPPTMEMPIWTPRHVSPDPGEPSRRSATWALLESMRADAITEAANDAATHEEASGNAQRRGSTPPE